MFLLKGAGVSRTAEAVKASLVAHADGVLVVVTGMGPHEVLMTGLIDLAITRDIIMVAGEAEACLVAGDERCDRERPVLLGRRAVNNYKIYFSHCWKVK